MELTLVAKSKNDYRLPYLLILPAVALIILLGIVPVIYSFIISLQEYELIDPPAKYIGLQNYINLLTNDSRFIHALIFTFLFAFVATSLEIIVGFIVAFLLSDKDISHGFSSVIRTLLLVSFVVPPVAISYAFKTLIYDQTFGYLNWFLQLFGLEGFMIFKGAVAAPVALLVMEVILRTPFIVIIFYAGISSIDNSVFDASAIDGVNWRQKVFSIIIPIIKPVAVIGFILRFMDALKMFDEIYVVTNGGPGHVTENISLFASTQAFVYYHMGYACAATFLFLILIIFLVSLFMKKLDN